MAILNLTQHLATPEQVAAGVVDLGERERIALAKLLSFDAIPSGRDLEVRAVAVAQLAAHAFAEMGIFVPADRDAMIGGAPYLMASIEGALRGRGITPLYAFAAPSAKHLGFVEGRA